MQGGSNFVFPRKIYTLLVACDRRITLSFHTSFILYKPHQVLTQDLNRQIAVNNANTDGIWIRRRGTRRVHFRLVSSRVPFAATVVWWRPSTQQWRRIFCWPRSRDLRFATCIPTAHRFSKLNRRAYRGNQDTANGEKREQWFREAREGKVCFLSQCQ
jgi:hypothetical protein